MAMVTGMVIREVKSIYMKKRLCTLLLVSASVGYAVTAFGQNGTAPGQNGIASAQKKTDTLIYPHEKVIVETDSITTLTPGRRFAFNSFWDNWFVSAGVGGDLFFGNQNYLKSWTKRVTPTYDISIGKWLHPVFGLRAKAGGGPGKAFTTKDLPAIGTYLTTGAPDEQGVYTEKWNQLYGEIDLMLNLSNMISGYKYTRFYSAIFYIGAGAAKVLDQPKNDGDRTAMGTLGLINQFRINNYFDVNLEIKDAFVSSTYEREANDKTYMTFDAATIGITYHFGKGGDRPFQKQFSTKTVVQSTYTHLPDIAAKVPDENKPQEPVILPGKDVVIERTHTLIYPVAIFFELDKADISGRAKVNLAFVADIIKASAGAKFRLIGSADSRTATPEHNQELSSRRSNAVRDYLVKVLQVDPDQLIVDPIGGIDRYSPAMVNRTVIIQQEQP